MRHTGVEGQPLTVLGSAKQPGINPLLAEQRTHRTTLAALLKQLKLPDLDAAAAPVSRHREAALSRWAQEHGARG